MTRHHHLRRACAALAGSIAVLTVSQPVAQAIEDTPSATSAAETTASQAEATSSSSSLAATSSFSAADSACAASRTDSGQAGSCSTVATLATSAASVASPALVSKYADSTASDGTTLASAAAAGTIWTRTWSQEKRGFYYFNWKEKHIGRIFYDRGSRVWSTTAQSGYKGYHTCDLGYGVLYDVQIKACNTERRYDLNNNPISEWDRFRVHVVWRGIPLYTTHNMHVNAYPNGNVYGH